MALGTDEHGGRVRAMGFGVTQTQYFNTPRPKRKNVDGSNQASSELERRVRETEERNRKLEDKVDELIRFISSQHSSVASGSGVGGASTEPPNVDIASEPVARPSSAANVYSAPDPIAQPSGDANVYSAPDPIAQPSGTANVYSPSPPRFREEIAPAAAPPPTGGSSEETLPCWMHCLLEPSGMVLKVASGHIVKEKYLKDGKFSINMEEYLHKDYRRVYIEEANMENALLPCPLVDDSLMTVGQAVNGHVAWPKDYLTPVGKYLTQPPTKKLQKQPVKKSSEDLLGPPTQPLKHPGRPSKAKVNAKYAQPRQTSSIIAFWNFVKRWPKSSMLQFQVLNELFGVADDSIWLAKSDIQELCTMQYLGAQQIGVWCKYLKERLLDMGGLNRVYEFLNPGAIATDAGDESNRCQALVARMTRMTNSEKWLIAPYNNRKMFHWMLVVIQPSTQTVAYLDSGNDDIPDDLNFIISTSFTMYNRMVRRPDRPTQWMTPICPQQPDDKQCGYYVMKFIESFMVVEDPIQLLTQQDRFSTPYTNDEINIMRDRWIHYVKAEAERQQLPC
ncbi:hypothetical protein CsatB_003464 [Cannabis sativa]